MSNIERAFDTLEYANKLMRGGFSDCQAKTLAEVHADSLSFLISERLATKQDLNVAELGLRHDIKKLDLKIEQFRDELKRDIEQVRDELKRDIKELDLKIERVRDELKRDIQELWLRMTITLGGIMLGGLGLLVTLMKLFKL